MALAVGALVGLSTGLTFALGIILDMGGGSLTRGWDPGMNYLGFYGLFALPVFAIVAIVAMGLSRLLGGGIVMAVSIVGLGALLTHSILSSSPGAQLRRVTGRSGIPDLQFERFVQGHTFSDGTSYLWVARCSPEEADALVAALGLESIPTEVPFDPESSMMTKHRAVVQYEGVFEGGIDGMRFFIDPRGMVGAFSPHEQRFRLFWWPAAIAEKSNG